jgi:hypothetical protein
MLKLAHLTSFWPKGYACELLKLGEKSLEVIANIPNKSKTVLLLDALDEDPFCFGRVYERLGELTDATLLFHRTIISCRTQFFPAGSTDPFRSPGQVVVGSYRCPVVFLSLFDSDKIEKYLVRRFPARFVVFGRGRSRRRAARAMLAKMGSLKCRPLLLAHIEDILDSGLEVWSEFSVYDALMRSWLLREVRKLGRLKPRQRTREGLTEGAEPDYSLGEEFDAWHLERACLHLAVRMQEARHTEISALAISKLAREVPEVGRIPEVDITGRSLLNRNSRGEFRFSHYSIQEFLVVKAFLAQALDDDIAKPRFVAADVTIDRIVAMLSRNDRLEVSFEEGVVGAPELSFGEGASVVPWTPLMVRFARASGKLERKGVKP